MAETIVVDIEFKTNVQKISKDLESVKDSLAETNENLEDISKTGKNTEGALKKIGNGFKGMGLAMKTLGIGLVIEAFNFLKDIMMQNQTVIDAVSVATETAGVIFNQISSVITDVFNAVSESSEGFEGLKEVMGSLLDVAVTPLKLSFYAIKLGIQSAMLAWEDSFLGGGDEGKIAQLTADIQETKDALVEVATDGLDAVKNIGENIGEAVTEIASAVTIAAEVGSEGIKEISVSGALATGQALADAKKNEELLEVIRAKQQLQSQLEAEQQRQIRDDVRLTFEERIAANEELGRILDEQISKEKAVADEKVRIAALELSTQKDSVDLQIKYQQALLEQIDIDERIAGQRSEQLTNEASLQQEAFDLQVELAEQQKQLEQDAFEFQKKLDEEKKAQQDANIDSLQSSIQMAGDLFAEGTAASKVSGVASATIDTWKAVNMALASAPPPLSYIQAALSLATGLKSIKNIMSVKTEKPANVDAPSGGDIPSGAMAESDTVDLSNIPSMTEQFNDQFGQQQPVQAYVVEQDVTSSQQINTMIQQKATL